MSSDDYFAFAASLARAQAAYYAREEFPMRSPLADPLVECEPCRGYGTTAYGDFCEACDGTGYAKLNGGPACECRGERCRC